MYLDSFKDLEVSHVIQIFEDLGFQATGHCTPLNSLENRVFLIYVFNEKLPDIFEEDSIINTGKFIIKFYRPNRWNHQQIQEEHDFLYELKESEIPVISPLRMKNGQSIFKKNSYIYSIWPNQKGRLVEEIHGRNLVVLGRLLARIHNVGSTKVVKHRVKFGLDEFGIKPLQYLIKNEFIRGSLLKRYESAAHHIFEKYNLYSQNIPFHRIHGDCHRGNLIQIDESYCFIDFDDTMEGPAVQDLWMLLPFDTQHEGDIQEFLSGYREFREFNFDWFQLVEPLRGLRYIYYAAWISRRIHEPNFQNTFPHFGSDEYWERETRDLENLVSGIFSQSDTELDNQSDNQKNDENLTNKDFFWDME